MIGPPRFAPWTILALAAALVASGNAARAQLEDQEDAGVVAYFEVDEGTFYQVIFGDNNRIVSAPEHLESLLRIAVADLDRACSLTEAQRRKLLLAGHGDVTRFLGRVTEARRLLARSSKDPTEPSALMDATRSLKAVFAAGLHGEGSLFAKTLAVTLRPDQEARRGDWLREKDRFRYKAKVWLVLANVEARVGFTYEQHLRYASLVLDETTPPRVPGGAAEEAVVLLKIAMIPEAKTRAIFDEAQWKALDQIFRKIREQEGPLRAAGLLD